MLPVISALLACVAGLFRSRASLGLENIALRHQLAVYPRRRCQLFGQPWGVRYLVDERTSTHRPLQAPPSPGRDH